MMKNGQERLMFGSEQIAVLGLSAVAIGAAML